MLDFSSLVTTYPFLSEEIFGNTMVQYGAALLAFVGVYAGLQLLKFLVSRYLQKITKKTTTDVDDLVVQMLASVRMPFYVVVSLAVGVQFLEGPQLLQMAVFYAALLVVAYRVVRSVQLIIDYAFQKGIRRRLEENPRFDASVVRLISNAVKGSVWGVALLVVLQNLGYDVTALVAGLGIGGLAIAIALQGVLSDIFASFSIYMDRPFQTGDFIVVGDVMGTVKYIGIKSTRIQSLWGEEVVVPNKDLTEARVKNYKKMENRIIVFSFGLTYETPSDKLRSIPEIVKDIFEGIELAELDRVHWKGFGDSSLDFEVMYRVDSSEYGVYMDIQQEINLQLKDRIEKAGMAFAYPTRTVYLHGKGVK